MNSLLTLILLNAFISDYDSINRIVDQSDDAIAKVDALLKHSFEIKNPSKALVPLNRAVELAEQLPDSMKSLVYLELGILHGRLYQLDSSKHYFNLVLNITSSTENHVQRIGALNGLGNVARTESLNKEASEYFQAGLKITESNQGDVFLIWRSKLLGNIAGIFYDMDDFQSAVDYTLEALKFSEQVEDYDNVGINHIQLGYAYVGLGDLDKAIMHNQEAARILENLNDTAGLIYQYYNMAGIYQKSSDHKKALEFYGKCASISELFGEAETHIGSILQIGKVYLTEGNYLKAEEYADNARKMSSQMNLLPNMMDSYDLLYEIYYERKLYRKALEYRNVYMQLSDSLKNENSLKQINDFKVKYETAEKERAIAELNARHQIAELELERKNSYQTFLIAAVILVILISVYIYKTQQQKNQLKEQLMMGELSDLRLKIKELLGKYEGQFDVEMDGLNQKLVTPLSEREFDVFKMIFSQKTNQQIADDLFVSINTVKTHLKNIYSKLGVNNRKEALELVFKEQYNT